MSSLDRPPMGPEEGPNNWKKIELYGTYEPL